MVSLRVVDDSGPRLLGVYLSCARNYATLDDLELEFARKDRVLFGLLMQNRLGLFALSAQLMGFPIPKIFNA